MTKLISWNVNGLRAVLQKGFLKYLEKEDADIVCLQETKLDHEKTIPFKDYPYVYWSCADKKGYSGTAVLSKIKPLHAYYGITLQDHDHDDPDDPEGRIITLEFAAYFLVTVYTPNSQRGLLRLAYRKKWDKEFLAFLKQLEKKKPIIFCGDLNVAHQPIDLAHPASNYNKTAGYTQTEIDGFDQLIAAGFIDTFRVFHKESGQYSWWSYMFNARQKNVGWRIDYFCVSKTLKPKLVDAFIRPEIMGSDHAPVGLILKD